MKRIILLSALFISLSIFNNISAQHISVNININSQPAWGPVGYDYARFYYFPDIDCYYDVNMSLFYFLDRGHWVSARYLPYAYHNYNLYRIYKVVINDHNPWRYHHNHRKSYAKYRGNHSQVVIYSSRDKRYNKSRKNRVEWLAPEHRSNNRSNYARGNSRNNNNRNQNYSRSEQSSDRSANSSSARTPQSNRSPKNNSRINNSRSNYNDNLRYTNNTQSNNSSQSRTASSSRSSNRSQTSSRSASSARR